MTELETITVMVVDDHPIWREGVASDLTERGLTSSPPPRTRMPRCGSPPRPARAWC